MKPLDPPAFLALLAFAIAIPLLSGTLVLNVIEEQYKYGPLKSPAFRFVHYTFFASIVIALSGIAAAFWHASWFIGLIFIVSQVLAIIVYSMYISKLSKTDTKATAKGA